MQEVTIKGNSFIILTCISCGEEFGISQKDKQWLESKRRNLNYMKYCKSCHHGRMKKKRHEEVR